jgi:hypothetical protein
MYLRFVVVTPQIQPFTFNLDLTTGEETRDELAGGGKQGEYL